MTPILTAEQMREADRRAIEELNFPSLVLMENAARGACDVLEDQMTGLSDSAIVVLCGKGNNGGDGLALARHAAIRGAFVTCLLLAPTDELTGDVAVQYGMLGGFEEVEILDWEAFREQDWAYDVIVDGMLGTGARGALRAEYGEAVEWANSQPSFRFAIDIPTGLDADTGIAGDHVFHADCTATMAAVKPGLLMNDGVSVAGDIAVVTIGTPGELYGTSRLEALVDDYVRSLLPTVIPDRHKYHRGKTLVVAGSRGMSGAGVLTATAASVSGAGLVVYALPASAEGVPQSVPPEIMTRFLSSDGNAFAADAWDGIVGEMGGYAALALGPGLSRAESVAPFVRQAVKEFTGPIVLDADGLNVYAGDADALRERNDALVITPHHGEMVRLLGIEQKELRRDQIGIARDTAVRLDCVVVLKGAPTVVAVPDGRVWVNSIGNPGMATGGTGDVLTGMIASLVGQTGDVAEGTLAAVYLHSLAGDIAAGEMTEYAMTASDIITAIPAAFRAILK